jgi:16S rRNA (guanine966-N2)-methyltransferase
VVFVEHDARAAELIERNLAHCRIADGYVMIRAEFTRALRQLPSDRRFDVALLDPPYDQADLASVVEAAAGRMAPGGILVLEHATRREVPARAGQFAAVRQTKAGDSTVTFYREAPEGAAAATEEA